MPSDDALSDAELSERQTELLRRFMAVAHLTAADFERRYGVGSRNIERYIRGERIDPRRRDLHFAIARALGIPLDTWLTSPPVVQLTPLDQSLLQAALQHGLERLPEPADQSGSSSSTPTPRRRSRSPRDRLAE